LRISRFYDITHETVVQRHRFVYTEKMLNKYFSGMVTPLFLFA